MGYSLGPSSPLAPAPDYLAEPEVLLPGAILRRGQADKDGLGVCPDGLGVCPRASTPRSLLMGMLPGRMGMVRSAFLLGLVEPHGHQLSSAPDLHAGDGSALCCCILVQSHRSPLSPQQEGAAGSLFCLCSPEPSPEAGAL